MVISTDENGDAIWNTELIKVLIGVSVSLQIQGEEKREGEKLRWMKFWCVVGLSTFVGNYIPYGLELRVVTVVLMLLPQGKGEKMTESIFANAVIPNVKYVEETVGPYLFTALRGTKKMTSKAVRNVRVAVQELTLEGLSNDELEAVEADLKACIQLAQIERRRQHKAALLASQSALQAAGLGAPPLPKPSRPKRRLPAQKVDHGGYHSEEEPLTPGSLRTRTSGRRKSAERRRSDEETEGKKKEVAPPSPPPTHTYTAAYAGEKTRSTYKLRPRRQVSSAARKKKRMTVGIPSRAKDREQRRKAFTGLISSSSDED